MVRRALAAAMLPLIVAMEQAVVSAEVAASCSRVRGSGGAESPWAVEPEGTQGGVVAVTLRSGLVVASQTVLVTATVCGPPGRPTEPGSVRLRIEARGLIGRFTMQVGWERSGMGGDAW